MAYMTLPVCSLLLTWVRPNSNVPLSFPPIPKEGPDDLLSLIWALFGDGGGTERGILEAYVTKRFGPLHEPRHGHKMPRNRYISHCSMDPLVAPGCRGRSGRANSSTFKASTEPCQTAQTRACLRAMPPKQCSWAKSSYAPCWTSRAGPNYNDHMPLCLVHGRQPNLRSLRRSGNWTCSLWRSPSKDAVTVPNLSKQDLEAPKYLTIRYLGFLY